MVYVHKFLSRIETNNLGISAFSYLHSASEVTALAERVMGEETLVSLFLFFCFFVSCKISILLYFCFNVYFAARKKNTTNIIKFASQQFKKSVFD